MTMAKKTGQDSVTGRMLKGDAPQQAQAFTTGSNKRGCYLGFIAINSTTAPTPPR